MRWGKEPTIKMGEERIVERFLWLPTCIKYRWRWLEKARIKQVFIRGRNYYSWMDSEWADEKGDE